VKNLVLDVLVDADAPTVFRAFTDWPAQGRWMVGTDVRPVDGDGHGQGARLEAWSGVGRLGFLDTMVITEWEDDRRVVVEHTGTVVRGSGVMEVFALPGGRSRFVWSEHLELPLGQLGKAGWLVVRPAFAAGVQRSLRQFAVLVEAGELGRE
jgi:uncharacterized protein YndB with AHSA1/START domain